MLHLKRLGGALPKIYNSFIALQNFIAMPNRFLLPRFDLIFIHMCANGCIVSVLYLYCICIVFNFIQYNSLLYKAFI